ncbi:MAG: leucine-rich repeat domain-containing protein [Porphyromonas sp.]|uniref:leucine-rich repeat domain-containing protein n=1 Tax=Porphyromonas sp. TaxID=1924944 RepID=UPI001A4A60D3|nr:leucine-rich repeat domain-containing protein [Porphyromonas sp.]MBL6452416.1 leucine-rich repeat domain-containing protein [Porphyromonas sp.]
MKDANLSSQAAEQSIIRLSVDKATGSGKLCLGLRAVGDITIEGVAESPKTGGVYYHYTLTSSEVIIRGDVTRFNCGTYGDNSIVSLDVSHAVNLKELYCHGNKLTSLDLSKNAALTELDCHNNQLTSLDLSHCVNLEGVGCTDNQLTSLDMAACSNLRELLCSGNKELAMLKLPESPLSRLMVQSCKALKRLHCPSKTLEELDICGCEALEEVDARDSKLGSIWVVDCPNLRVVRFDGTALDNEQARRLVDGLPDRRGSVAGELHLFTAEQEEEAMNIVGVGGLPLGAADKNWNISIVPERLWAALRDIQKDVATLLGRATE